MKKYLAIDIGASSGRHIIGYMNDCNELVCEEIYRFPNNVQKLDGHLLWDVESLFKEVKIGIKKCLEKYPKIESMSIDTWGVDYVLLKGNEEILPVYAYRDNRTDKAIDLVHERISFEKLYSYTGCQFQKFNTIYQLYSDMVTGRLEEATDFLYIPEYLMYKLTGEKKHEYTNASTSGMLDRNTNEYSQDIIEALELPKKVFYKLDKPKTVVGWFKQSVIDEVGGNIKVVLCPTHDTASAVEGIPMEGNHPYISSGTWSLLGVKIINVINTKEAMKANYSNEYGPNYIRFQKNIMGLWIIQCLSREWNLDFVEMIKMAKESSFEEVYDVNDSCFTAPNDMASEITKWFKRNNKKPPVSKNDIINSTYHSLAYSYKLALEELESITNKKYDCLYIVGGGAKNTYLNELTEKMSNKKVIALPIEATAIGNLITQMKE